MTPGEYQHYSESIIEKFDEMLRDQTVQKNIEEARTLLKGFGKYMEARDKDLQSPTDKK